MPRGVLLLWFSHSPKMNPAGISPFDQRVRKKPTPRRSRLTLSFDYLLVALVDHLYVLAEMGMLIFRLRQIPLRLLPLQLTRRRRRARSGASPAGAGGITACRHKDGIAAVKETGGECYVAIVVDLRLVSEAQWDAVDHVSRHRHLDELSGVKNKSAEVEIAGLGEKRDISAGVDGGSVSEEKYAAVWRGIAGAHHARERAVAVPEDASGAEEAADGAGKEA